MSRKAVLLRAAYDILWKCEHSSYVLSPFEVTAFYDGANCDGLCLKDDIAIELDLPRGEKPLKSGDEKETET